MVVEGEHIVDCFNEQVTHVVFNDEWIEGLEERSKRGAEGYRKGGNEVPSRRDEHRVIFCSFFGSFFGIVLIRILLANSLLFKDSGGQCADLVDVSRDMSIHNGARGSKTHLSQ